MPTENPSSDLDQTLGGERFDSPNEAADYLSSLRINPNQFSRNPDGNLVSVHGNPITETDPQTGKIRFTETGVNATAGWIEDLGSAPDCFWG